MIFRSLKISALLATGLTLASCTTPASNSAIESAVQTKQVSSDLKDARIPNLRSPYFEKSWGAPNVAVFNDGTYLLSFRQETSLNYVIVQGLLEARPAPATPPDWSDEDLETPAPSHKQSWRLTNILGTPVKWYQSAGGSGADFPCYETVDFTLTAPDGRTGHYRVRVSTDSPLKAEKWIRRLAW
ncbi:MAG: hypothetical protein CFE26_01110 [Verrucomicrobiales bacterium VVV1]|nr:MAG: hypothetical protein CFE26_01110 [Verrucomicrobiales bacterium VVV1]